MHKEKIITILDKTIEWAFYALIAAITFSIAFVEAAIAVIAICWFVKKIILKNYKFRKNLFFIFIVFFVLWNLFSIFKSDYLYESIRGFIKIIKYSLLFIITIDTFKDRQILKNAAFFLIIWSVPIALNGIIQGVIGFDLIRLRTIDPLDFMMRISSSFRQSNDFGAYLVVLIPIYLSYIYSKNIKLKNKFYFLLGVLLLLFCLAKTYSRGAWLALCGAVLILGLLKSKKLFIALLILILIIPLILPHQLKNRVFNVLNLKEGTSWERLKLWNGAWLMIKTHPFIGFGINTYTKNFPRYKPVDYPDVIYTHNCYLQMATETGLIGLGLFLLFVVLVFIYIGRHFKFLNENWMKNTTTGLFSGLIGFLVHSGVDTHLYSVNLAVMFYFFLGFCVSLCNYAENNPA